MNIANEPTPVKTSAGRKIAPSIDHTLLKPDADREQIITLCKEALAYGFACVCINPVRVPLAVQVLAESQVKVCTVIGFPLGAAATQSKAQETGLMVKTGAQELDMVMAIGALKDRDYQFVLNDIKAVVLAAEGRTVKVIIETCLLTNDEKVAACKLTMQAGAHFVKTSTGLAGGGATADDVRLLFRTAAGKIRVKASGGIRTCQDALSMLEAGAARLGTSNSVAIVTAPVLESHS